MPDRQRVSRQSCAQRVRTERTECHAQETVQRANRQPRIHAASTTRKRIPRSCSLAISASPIACAGVTQPEMFGSLSNANDSADSASILAVSVYPGSPPETSQRPDLPPPSPSNLTLYRKSVVLGQGV